MAYRPREPHQAASGYPYTETYDNMYDDPREPVHHRGSSPPKHNSPYDRSRTPPRPDFDRSDEYHNVHRGRDSSRDEYYSNSRSKSRPEHRGGYRDRDREEYRSPTYGSRSRSHSRTRRRSRSPNFGGPPNKEVMMDGIPQDMTEEDISKELKRQHTLEDVEDIRVIKDRNTKLPRGFGFLRFVAIDSARLFLENNYPTIRVRSSQSDVEHDVRVAFSRERDDRSKNSRLEVEWTCPNCDFANFAGRKQCYKCQTPFSAFAAGGNQNHQPEFVNIGDSDASPHGDPSQFLLLRGLEPTVTEEILAKGVAKLYKPSGASQANASSQPKKGKVASTTGDANLGAKEGSIRRILLVRDRRTSDSWRYGFAEFASVEDAQAALIRYNSFERFTISSKPVTASYIHAGVFVPVFDLDTESPECMFSAIANPAIKLRYWDDNAYVKELVVNVPEEHLQTPAEAAKSAADAAAAAAEKEGLISNEEAEAKNKKRKLEMKDSTKQKKATPAHLQFWSNRHAELHGGKASKAALDGSQYEEPQKGSPDSNDKEPSQSYADPKRMCCLLCTRQFKSNAEVNKHERLSQLHRDNMSNEDLVKKAMARLEKSGIKAEPVDSTTEYRDRAKERRKAFGNTKVSLPLKKQAQEPVKAPSPPQSQSKGASLLGKMGWSAGEGLGAKGTGMTAPIETNLYAAGVGLGAQGGKVGNAVEEAGKNTKSNYADFVERAKDKAKERYEKMAGESNGP